MDDIKAAFMDLITWKQQELRRQRAAPQVSPVETVEGYRGLWDLYRELSLMLKQTRDLSERLEIQQARAGVERDINAAKADPVLAPQITAWWLSRYPNGGKP